LTKSSCACVALAVGLLGAAWSTSVEGAESFVTTAVYTTDHARCDSGIRTVSYSCSTGTEGHRLKWLPHGTSKANPSPSGWRPATDEPEARSAQYTASVAAKPADKGAVDPFDDPFEDAKGSTEPMSPKATLHDEVLQRAQPKPLITRVLPQMAVEDPAPDSEGPESPAQIPEFFPEESLAVGPRMPEDPCSSVQLKSIRDITYDISAKGDKFPQECPLVEGELPDRQTHGWAPTTFTWKASGLCHKPAYFEEVHVERYGHSCGPYLQPLVSGAHFFLTVPVLPYKMGLYPPNECIYSLGYYRPGSCAPYMLDPLPISIRAGLAEAGVWTGMVFLIP